MKLALCIKKDEPGFKQWWSNRNAYADQNLACKFYLVDRNVCEDPANGYLQFIPYIVATLTETGCILKYDRPTSGDENKLHKFSSIGFGGHVDTVVMNGIGFTEPGEYDLSHAQFSETIFNCVRKELSEELGISGIDYDIQEFISHMPVQFDDTNDPLNEVHLLLPFVAEVFSEDKVNPDELEVEGLESIFPSPEQLVRFNFEPWSRWMLAKIIQNPTLLEF